VRQGLEPELRNSEGASQEARGGFRSRPDQHDGAAEGPLRPFREAGGSDDYFEKDGDLLKYNPASFMAEWRVYAVWRHAWLQDVHEG
jgi:hypothetical protein